MSMIQATTFEESKRQVRARKLALENAIAVACVMHREVSDAQDEADEADKEVDRMNHVVLEAVQVRDEFLKREREHD